MTESCSSAVWFVFFDCVCALRFLCTERENVALRNAIETIDGEREQAQKTAVENARLAHDYRAEMQRMETEQMRVEATLCDKMTQIVGLQARLRAAMVMQQHQSDDTSTHNASSFPLAEGRGLGNTYQPAALSPVRDLEFGGIRSVSPAVVTMGVVAGCTCDTPVTPAAPPFSPPNASVERAPSRLPVTPPPPCQRASLPFSSPVPRTLLGLTGVRADVASPAESDPTMVFSPQPLQQEDSWLRQPGNSLEPLNAAATLVDPDPCPPVVPVPALFMMDQSSDDEKQAMLHVLLFQLLRVCMRKGGVIVFVCRLLWRTGCVDIEN
jgi:hypothetical protein